MKNKWLKFFRQKKTKTKPNKWVLTGKTYARPRLEIGILELLSGSTLEKALFGTTTLIWECANYGDIKQEVVLGNDEQVLDELLDKASELGTHTIDRGGETFVITKWTPPVISQKANTIPIRSV